MLLEDPKKIAKVLDITLLLQVFMYIVATVLFYVWRDLDELVYTGQVGVLQLVVACFVGLGCFNLVLLMYGMLEAPDKRRFLKPHRIALICLIVLLIVLARPVDDWIAMRAGAGTNMPFIRY